MSSSETSEAADSRVEAKAPSSRLALSGILLAAGIAGSLLGLLSSSAALVYGVALGVLVGNPLISRTRPLTSQRPKRPWFILGFLIAAALATYVPALHSAAGAVSEVARRALVATLFLIGANLTRDTLRTVGFRPLVQGVTLWAIVGTGTLGAILAGLIR